MSMSKPVLPPLTESDLYYARRLTPDKPWRGFYRHGTTWSVSGAKDDEAVVVRCRERQELDPESPYWGWEYSPKHNPHPEGGRWSMIWPSRTQLEICFPYGTKRAIEQGHGRPVNLLVEVVK
jgi:hypothetical protein